MWKVITPACVNQCPTIYKGSPLIPLFFPPSFDQTHGSGGLVVVTANCSRSGLMSRQAGVAAPTIYKGC